MNLLLFSALAPLALAEGTRKNKIEAMKEVCDKGFVDKKENSLRERQGGQSYILYESARLHSSSGDRKIPARKLLAAVHGCDCTSTRLFHDQSEGAGVSFRYCPLGFDAGNLGFFCYSSKERRVTCQSEAMEDAI